MGERRPFANGTEWDAWSSQWCQRCTHEPTCPLLDLVFCHDTTPAEWVPDQPGTLWRPYICTAFEAAR